MPLVFVRRNGNHCEVDPHLFHVNKGDPEVVWVNQTGARITIYFPNDHDFFVDWPAAVDVPGKRGKKGKQGRSRAARVHPKQPKPPYNHQYYSIYCEATQSFAHGGSDDPGGSVP